MVQILFGEDFSTLFLLHHLCLQDSAKSTKERNFYCKKRYFNVPTQYSMRLSTIFLKIFSETEIIFATETNYFENLT